MQSATFVVVGIYSALMAWCYFFWLLRPGGRSWQLAALAVLGTALTAATITHMAFRVPAYPNNVIAGAGYLCSLALLVWSIAATRERRLSLAFFENGPRFLLCTGPYRYIRHPFYTSYLLFWLSGVCATREYWLLAGFAVMLGGLFHAARGEERMFEASSLAARYKAYRRRAGMFWPKLPLG